MKDIARDLKVSVVTVSKVLRQHGDISPETRARVLQRVQELNYQPNRAARSLVTGRSFSIGLVVPDLVHPFFGEIAKAIARRIRARDYSLVIASSEENPEIETREIEALLARQVDAIILASAHSSARKWIFQRIAERGVACVLIDRAVRGLKASFVGVDDRAVGVLATEHLLARGCRRIAHIRGPRITTADGRFAGYRAALRRHRLDALPGLVITMKSGDDRADESGYEAMKSLLAARPRPDGVFCFNDEAATGALQAILEGGLRVPADIAVIGVGNMRYAELLRAPLSSIDQNSASIGDQAARLALELIESRAPVVPQKILVPVQLVARASSAPA